MVLVALTYGLLASGLMLWVGAPLVGYVGRKNEAEGYFRFAMMRIRDNAESVALMNGARYEQAVLGRFYETVVARWMAIVWQHGHLTWITNASGPMIPIVPLLFAAPKYISGELTLGQVTQLAAAFVQVQIAISWVVDNYNRVAEWYASARRVMDIVNACAAIDPDIEAISPTPARPTPGKGAAVRLSDFEIADGSGRPLLSGDDIAARPGEAVHVHGDSSTGKSTLVRVIAGLWPTARGKLTLPDRSEVMIAPQKSYLPLGSLRGALLYPDPALKMSDERLRSALETMDLAALGARLDEVARWDQVLSNGERQRLAMARLLIHRPRVIILDDALSALEEAAQSALLARLRLELPEATIVSLAQRPAPPGGHDRQLVLQRRAGRPILVGAKEPALAEVN
jgi:putative ATP-binding cassette transporter